MLECILSSPLPPFFICLFFWNTSHPRGKFHCWCGYRGLHKDTGPSVRAGEPSNEVAAGIVRLYLYYIKIQKLSLPPVPVYFSNPSSVLSLANLRAWEQGWNAYHCVCGVGGPGLNCAFRRSPRWQKTRGLWERVSWGGSWVNHHSSGEIRIGVWLQSYSL